MDLHIAVNKWIKETFKDIIQDDDDDYNFDIARNTDGTLIVYIDVYHESVRVGLQRNAKLAASVELQFANPEFFELLENEVKRLLKIPIADIEWLPPRKSFDFPY